MTFENITVGNIENAIRGMRNPLSSHGKSDSYRHDYPTGVEIPDDPRYRFNTERYEIGDADHALATRLIAGGEPHRKFLRQIFVSVDIVKAPSYWLHELATYKVGTTLDCSSTMHRITSRDLTSEDFEEPTTPFEAKAIGDAIDALNTMRADYVNAKAAGKDESAERFFLSIKHVLPSSYCYERMTWTANYEVLANIYRWRRTHRLPAWRVFCKDFIEKLPYSEFILGGNS